MKKFVVCLLALILCLACMSIASAEKPGDTVSVPISLSHSGAAYVKVKVSYDTSVFELVKLSAPGGQVSGNSFNFADLGGVPSGNVATITLKIKSGAAAGTYTISASVPEAWDSNENRASASASGGKVTVEAPATPTPAPTEKPADPTPAPTEKPADPTPTLKPADPTPAPTAKPTQKPAGDRQYYAMTVSSIGPRFKDVSDLTKKWHMFSALDLSKDGVQTLDLIAGNIHKIGTVTLTVADGNVTVDYKIDAKPVTVKSEFFTFFPNLAAIETVDTSKLTGYEFGEKIALGEDKNVIFYLFMNVGYHSDVKNANKFYENGKEYTALVNDMLALMD